jgi:hypothetical protein
MKKKFNESGIAVIEFDFLDHDGTIEQYDLNNCYDIFGRCIEPTMTFAEIESRFDELWQSGEVVTIEQF